MIYCAFPTVKKANTHYLRIKCVLQAHHENNAYCVHIKSALGKYASAHLQQPDGLMLLLRVPHSCHPFLFPRFMRQLVVSHPDTPSMAIVTERSVTIAILGVSILGQFLWLLTLMATSSYMCVGFVRVLPPFVADTKRLKNAS